MLITSDKELKAIYPSSQIKSIGNLLSTFEDVERNTLCNILGMSLYDQMLTDYRELLDLHNGIWADCIDQPDDKVFIIRACQSVIVFHALDDNVGILSSSLNMIGGFNRAETENYEGIDKDLRRDLKNDLYRRKLKSIETLLCLLEEDAHRNRIYTELWKESQYYYYQSRLLLPSARSMHPYFMNLGNEPHARFVSLIPYLFKAQDLSIGNRIGQELLEELLTATEPTPSPLTPELSESGLTDHREVTGSHPEQEGSEPEPSEDAVNGSPTEAPVPEASALADEESEPSTPSPETNEGTIPSPTEEGQEGGGPSEENEETDEGCDSALLTAERRKVLTSALPHFRRALAYFVMADTTEEPRVADDYRLSAEQYLNKAVRYFVARPDIFREELRTDLSEDFRKWNGGKTLDDIERIARMKEEGKRIPPCRPRPASGFADFGALIHK